jgi:hypothetical protein
VLPAACPVASFSWRVEIVTRRICRHIARKFNCRTNGITLSPNQAQRGNELAAAGGLAEQCHFEVADALVQPFDDQHFDFVWSMESGEHMPDKQYAPTTQSAHDLMCRITHRFAVAIHIFIPTLPGAQEVCW